MDLILILLTELAPNVTLSVLVVLDHNLPNAITVITDISKIHLKIHAQLHVLLNIIPILT